jgi:chromate transporter
VIFALASIYVTFGDVPNIKTLFLGVQAVAVVIVIEALLRVSKKALIAHHHWVIAALAFIGIFFFSVPYPLIVLAAGLYGALAGYTQSTATTAQKITVSLRQTITTIALGLALWALPILLIDITLGTTILTELGIFFSKLATVTFGGAYAVLAYMAQDVVTKFGWLTAGEMMDGLGLAETTPGPLILVTQFVGFIAGYRDGGYGLALAAGLVTLWVTFVPCFIWIFAGAPYIDWISAQPRLNAALKAITAAVVGVILNLSLWFALHVLFGRVVENEIGILTLWTPDIASLNWLSILLIALATYLLLVRHIGLGWVLAISAIVALGFGLVGVI